MSSDLSLLVSTPCPVSSPPGRIKCSPGLFSCRCSQPTQQLSPKSTPSLQFFPPHWRLLSSHPRCKEEGWGGVLALPLSLTRPSHLEGSGSSQGQAQRTSHLLPPPTSLWAVRPTASGAGSPPPSPWETSSLLLLPFQPLGHTSALLHFFFHVIAKILYLNITLGHFTPCLKSSQAFL